MCAIYEEKTAKTLEAQMKDAVKDLNKVKNKLAKLNKMREETGDSVSAKVVSDLQVKVNDINKELGKARPVEGKEEKE